MLLAVKEIDMIGSNLIQLVVNNPVRVAAEGERVVQ